MKEEHSSLQARAFAYVEEHRAGMLDLLKRLVSLESYSADVADVNRVIELLAREMAPDFVQRTESYPEAGSTLVAVSGGERPNAPVVFIGHCDTVHPAGSLAGRMPLRTDDEGKIYGPGVLDMKGGLVIALYTIRALNAAGYDKRPFKFVISGDEENGHVNSRSAEVIRSESKGGAAAFVGETGYLDNKIIIQRKGCGRFRLESFGRSAHAGICPEKGCHAILDMARRIEAVQALNDNREGITYNVGVIQGGTVPNAVPDYCCAEIDVRYTEEKQIPAILEALNGIAGRTYVDGVTAKLSGGLHFLPMEATPGNRALFEIVREAVRSLGGPEPYAGSTGGASDAAYASAEGVPTVCSMGIQGGLSHTPDEYAVIETLYDRTKVLITSILLAEESLFVTTASCS